MSCRVAEELRAVILANCRPLLEIGPVVVAAVEGDGDGTPPRAIIVKMRTRRMARDLRRGHRCWTKIARSSSECAGRRTVTQCFERRASRGLSNNGPELGFDVKSADL